MPVDNGGGWERETVEHLDTLVDRLKDLVHKLEWGSCDGCGRHTYCPLCDAYAYSDAGHFSDCPVREVLGGS